MLLVACGAREQDAPGDRPDDQSGSSDVFKPAIIEKPVPGEPQSGGTLTVAEVAQPRSLDPAKTLSSGTTGGTVMAAIYDPLMRFDMEQKKFVPQLAESVEPNDDYTQWTITMRDGVKFSDGTPVDADAVIGSMKYYLDNKGYDAGVIGPLWKGAHKVDDRTVRVDLAEPWGTFDATLALGFGHIVAPAAIEGGQDHFKPIGAGPFIFASHSQNEELVLQANPDYWDGKPYLDKLRFVWLGPDQTKTETFDGEQVQGALIQDPQLVKKYREAETAGFTWAYSRSDLLLVNHREGRPGHDPKVRAAITHAIEPETLYDRIFDGIGQPGKELWIENSAWANDAEVPPYDTELAKQELAEAKTDGYDGELTFVALSSATERDAALTLTAQLEAAGFTVKVDTLRNPAEMVQRVMFDTDYDISRTSLMMSDEHVASRLYAQMHSKSFKNQMGYASPEMDRLIEELRALPADQQADTMRKIEEQYHRDFASVNLGGSTWYYMFGDNVHGLVPNTEMMPLFAKAWVS
ncbi:ABC transporter substrate-binding protein [Enemella sp. A6]|uniref:ABC transporter substrate-binding protein n=1 Tax=Enemella sp. A6 TaxID=3440152 RepID=UPI003EB91E51